MCVPPERQQSVGLLLLLLATAYSSATEPFAPEPPQSFTSKPSQSFASKPAQSFASKPSQSLAS